MQASVSVDIDAPPERVWAVMCDTEAWPQWTASVTDVRRLDTGHFDIGSRVRIKQPKFPPAVWTVESIEPGRTFTWVAGGQASATWLRTPSSRLPPAAARP